MGLHTIMIRWSSQLWVRAGITCFLLGVVFYILPLTRPFILSLALTLLLWPLVDAIEQFGKKRLRWHHMPRWVAIIPAFLIVILVITLVSENIFVPLIAELTKFINNMPYLLAQIIDLLGALQTNYLHMHVPAQINEIINSTITRLGNYGIDLAQRAVLTIFTIAGFLVELLLVPILTFYMLKDGKKLAHGFINFFPLQRVKG